MYEEALKNDRAPTKVLQFNDFGLVAITRKRVKQSLERTLSVPCPTCQATGMVKSPTTVCNEIYIELRKMRKHFESADVLLRVNPETVKVLKAQQCALADGIRRADRQEHPGQERRYAASGAIRHPGITRTSFTPHSLSDACWLEHGLVRELLVELEDAHYAEISGSGLTAVVIITRSGKLALKAAFQAPTSINVEGGFVQVGDHNVQVLANEGDDEDEEDEDDDEDGEDE